MQVRGDRLPQQRVGGHDDRERHRGGGRRLGEPPGLLAHELADSQGDRQHKQRKCRCEPEEAEQRTGQPVARGRDVGGGAARGRVCHQAGAGQQGDAEAADDEAQQIDGFTDPAFGVILDDDDARRRGTG